MTSTEFEERPETARGRAIHRALLAVHHLIRRDLAFVENLAAAVLDGAPAEDVQEQLGTLKSDSILWQFQLSCLRYCSFVHMHHHAEDVEFFDELEQTNPALGPILERLREDHRAVSDYLDAVEAAARTLATDESLEARRAVADGLQLLKRHLLTHLDFEEESVAATARRLPDF
jgi:hypothetical protein